ncbi:hypothetical protein THAOC_27328, partial [Thalassiosira oceanica]
MGFIPPPVSASDAVVRSPRVGPDDAHDGTLHGPLEVDLPLGDRRVGLHDGAWIRRVSPGYDAAAASVPIVLRTRRGGVGFRGVDTVVEGPALGPEGGRVAPPRLPSPRRPRSRSGEVVVERVDADGTPGVGRRGGSGTVIVDRVRREAPGGRGRPEGPRRSDGGARHWPPLLWRFCFFGPTSGLESSPESPAVFG